MGLNKGRSTAHQGRPYLLSRILWISVTSSREQQFLVDYKISWSQFLKINDIARQGRYLKLHRQKMKWPVALIIAQFI